MRQTEQSFAITTSWDDGDPLDLRVADLLAKYGLTGTFYVPRSGQRAVMKNAEIRKLGHDFEIGGHTLEHVVIEKLSDREARVQLSGSRAWIEDLTGKSCRVFCFPAGRFRNRQLRLVREAGYHAARTVELFSISSPRRVDGLWVIPTTIQVYPHRFPAYAKNALKRFSVSSAFNLQKALFIRNWTELAKVLLLRTVKRGGVFHLWGHSWEIEEQQQWQPLEDFLRFAAQLNVARCATNGDLCLRYAEGRREGLSFHSNATANDEAERTLASPLESERS